MLCFMEILFNGVNGFAVKENGKSQRQTVREKGFSGSASGFVVWCCCDDNSGGVLLLLV